MTTKTTATTTTQKQGAPTPLPPPLPPAAAGSKHRRQHTAEERAAAGEDDVGVKGLAEVHVGELDRVDDHLVDTGHLEANQVGLEEHLRRAEPLRPKLHRQWHDFETAPEAVKRGVKKGGGGTPRLAKRGHITSQTPAARTALQETDLNHRPVRQCVRLACPATALLPE